MNEAADLKRTSNRVERLILGCGRINGASEFKQSAKLIETALKLGIRSFDTAPSYGEGESEDVLGAVLSGIEGVAITTKIGIPRPAARRASLLKSIYRHIGRPILAKVPALKAQALRLAATRDAGPYESPPKRQLLSSLVLMELEQSLRRLRRAFIDKYLIHEPTQFCLDQNTSDIFHELISQGMVGACGLAYGDCPETIPSFGSVIQVRYDEYSPSLSHAQKELIFHGVLRHGLRHRTLPSSDGGAGHHISRVLESRPGSKIIFSVSSVRQIKEIMADLS
jgi:aryl-alcohol dehydrogenase-like predicted oxidoreductase